MKQMLRTMFQRTGIFICGTLLLSLPFGSFATSSPDTGLDAMVAAWVDGWNAHDVGALGALLSPDVDFVLVNGVELKGRDEFKKVHGEQFAGRYDKSIFVVNGTPADTMVRSDVALLHWRWTITNVRNEDGTPAPTYKGIFTWVAVKSNGRWEIRAAQNTVDK